MKKYKFNITQTDIYKKEISVEATSLEEARELLDKEIEACPIDTRSNTFDSSEIDIEHPYEPVEGEKFARQCDATGEGMNEGFCVEEGEEYFKYEKDLLAYIKELGFDTMAEAYEDEVYYYTVWEDEDDYQYIFQNGTLVEI